MSLVRWSVVVQVAVAEAAFDAGNCSRGHIRLLVEGSFVYRMD